MQALRHWRVNVILNHMSQIVHVGIKLLIQSNSMRHSPIINVHCFTDTRFQPG